jgi:hypothetical protein
MRTSKVSHRRESQDSCAVKWRGGLLTDKDTKNIHQHTDTGGFEECTRFGETIDLEEMEYRDGTGEGHSHKHSDAKGTVLFGIPALEEGGDCAYTAHKPCEDHVATSCFRLAIESKMLGNQHTGGDQKGDADVVQGGGERFDGMARMTNEGVVDGGAKETVQGG